MNALGRFKLIIKAIDEFREQAETDVIKLPDTMPPHDVLQWLSDRFENEMMWRRGDKPKARKASG